MDTKNNDSWGIVELLGHLTLSGRITKPGDFGGLWQIDIPDGDSFRTEFFNSSAVYRIRITSEEIAIAYSRPSHDVIAYDAPIVTREEHERILDRARKEISLLAYQVSELREQLGRVNGLPPGQIEDIEGGYLGY